MGKARQGDDRPGGPAGVSHRPRKGLNIGPEASSPPAAFGETPTDSAEYQEAEGAGTGGVEPVVGQEAKAVNTSGTEPIRPQVTKRIG